jgi:hypothetical protein
LSRKYAESNGDYKAERQQESFRIQIIDPKVDSNAYIPAHGQSQFPRHRSLIDDFPSQHNKLSMLNLNAMEQRKIRVICKIVTIFTNFNRLERRNSSDYDKCLFE